MTLLVNNLKHRKSETTTICLSPIFFRKICNPPSNALTGRYDAIALWQTNGLSGRSIAVSLREEPRSRELLTGSVMLNCLLAAFHQASEATRPN